MKNNLAKRYIFRVSRRMPVGGKQKREFLAALQEDVEQYILENPSATRAQLEAQFGSPDDIAADFIAQMPYREINDKFRARNRIVAVAVAVAILVVTIWAAAVISLQQATENKIDGQGMYKTTAFGASEEINETFIDLHSCTDSA